MAGCRCIFDGLCVAANPGRRPGNLKLLHGSIKQHTRVASKLPDNIGCMHQIFFCKLLLKVEGMLLATDSYHLCGGKAFAYEIGIRDISFNQCDIKVVI